ncbi:Negative regulator of mitotic exit [Tulasnella sp. 419]|nr:Negative regulator of mitotic exit [Tulasnella sp. 419]
MPISYSPNHPIDSSRIIDSEERMDHIIIMTHGHLMFQLENVAYWVPGEGHAAALVDDVMYVFGGRGVDGKDLGDLAAFEISNPTWYVLQNMGPAPSGRSGHAVAAARRVVSPPASNNLTPTRQGAVSPMNNTSISQRAISPQQQRSMSPTTNAGQRAVSPTTTGESERASSPSSRNVIKLPKGAVTALGAGGVAMTAFRGITILGLEYT